MSDDTLSMPPLSHLEAVFKHFFMHNPPTPHADVIPTLLVLVAGVDKLMRDEARTRAFALSGRSVTRLHHKTVHDPGPFMKKLKSMEQIKITNEQRDHVSSTNLQAIEFKGGEVRLHQQYDVLYDDECMTPTIYNYPFVYPFPSGINNIHIDLHAYLWKYDTFQMDTLDYTDTVTGMATSTVGFTDRGKPAKPLYNQRSVLM